MPATLQYLPSSPREDGGRASEKIEGRLSQPPRDPRYGNRTKNPRFDHPRGQAKTGLYYLQLRNTCLVGQRQRLEGFVPFVFAKSILPGTVQHFQALSGPR